LYRRSRNKLREVLVVSDVNSAQAALHDYVVTHGIKPVTVMLDILEESYALESIPHLNSRDRGALLGRKKNQLFPRTRFNYSSVRRRSVSGRRDDQVFFSAITDDKVIQPWLGLLYDLQVPIAAVQSLPLLSEKLAKDLPGDDHKLLINITEDHLGVSLRQSYFKDNILAFSRFRQLKTNDLSELAATVKEEVDRSRRFVSRQFSLTQGVRIAAHFFYSSVATYEFFKTMDFSAINLEARFHHTCGYARSQGLALPDNSGIGQLLIAQLSRRSLARHYQDQQSQHYYKHHQVKKALNFASALMLSGSVIYSGLGFIENYQINASIGQLRNEQLTLAGRMEQTVDAPLTNNFNPFEMRTQLQVLKQLQQQTITPEAILTPISQVLQNYPSITLGAVTWGSKDDASQQQAIENLDPTQTTGNENRLVSLRLTASIEPFDGNYRKALALIERIAKEFGQTAQVKSVKNVKQPIEINAYNELSGTISQHTQDSEFILEMQWEHR
jgi:hypothetical protein